MLLQHASSDDGLSTAHAALDRAVALNPALAAGWGNRAIVRYALNDVAGALADLDVAVRLAPSAGLLLNRALAKEALGDLAGARRDLEAAAGMPDADQTDVAERLAAWGERRDGDGAFSAVAS
jgi:regulator of sirC expression with transglutaminase-like and TPR domain